MNAEIKYGTLTLMPATAKPGVSIKEQWKHGPYYILFFDDISAEYLIEFGNEKSSIPGSQAQIQARYEAGATFRTIRDLVDVKALTFENSGKIVRIIANIAKNQMKKWKQGKVPLDYSYNDYLRDVKYQVELKRK